MFMFVDDIGSAHFKAKVAASPIIWSFHLIGGGMALILSTFVLSSRLRQSSVKTHKALGKLYFLAIIFGSFGGLILSFDTDSNLISGVGLGLLSLFWFSSTLMAYLSARNRNLEEHKMWVYRSFVLTLSAVLFRVELGVLTAFTDASYFDIYATVTWLCWVPILIITEWWFVNIKLNT